MTKLKSDNYVGLIEDLSRDGIHPESEARFGQRHVQGGECPCMRNSANISLRSTIGHYCSSGSCAGREYKTIHGTVNSISALHFLIIFFSKLISPLTLTFRR